MDDRRNFDRVEPRITGWMSLTIDAKTFPVANISYGGLFIVAKTGDLAMGTTYEATLKVFDGSCTSTVEVSRETATGLGLRFNHGTPDTLLFLRETLERFHNGASLMPIDREALAEKYKTGGWTCLRGNGPTDLIYQFSNEKLENALVTFWKDNVYTEIKLSGGNLSTGRSIDAVGTSSRMQSDSNINPDVAREALRILVGLQDQPSLEQVFPFVQKISQVIGVETHLLQVARAS